MPRLRLATLLLVAGLAVPGTGTAADVSAELQVELQTAMLVHLDTIAPDGVYTYLDTGTQTLRTVYSANVHPMVVQAGDQFFVCSEFIDEEGERLTADFLVRKVGDSYRVVQTILGDRAALMALVEQGGQ
jgi:hypothetical protein